MLINFELTCRTTLVPLFDSSSDLWFCMIWDQLLLNFWTSEYEQVWFGWFFRIMNGWGWFHLGSVSRFGSFFDFLSASILVSNVASIFKVQKWTLGTTFGDKVPQKTPPASHRTVSCAWLVATRARHGAENGPSTILIDLGAMFGWMLYHVWSMLVEVVGRRWRKRQNDATLR